MESWWLVLTIDLHQVCCPLSLSHHILLSFFLLSLCKSRREGEREGWRESMSSLLILSFCVDAENNKTGLVEDCYTAFLWMHEHGHEYHIDKVLPLPPSICLLLLLPFSL